MDSGIGVLLDVLLDVLMSAYGVSRGVPMQPMVVYYE